MRTLLARLLRRPRRSNRRRGSAVVEFVVTVPIILIVLFGTIEYGNYFNELAMVTNAVRDGARFGSNQGTGTEARTRGAAATRILLEDSGFQCDLADPCTVNSTIINRNGVAMVEITVVIPYNQITHALPRFGATGAGLGLPSRMVAVAAYPLVGI